MALDILPIGNIARRVWRKLTREENDHDADY